MKHNQILIKLLFFILLLLGLNTAGEYGLSWDSMQWSSGIRSAGYILTKIGIENPLENDYEIFPRDHNDAYGAILSNLKKIDLHFSNIGVGCGETITLREFAELALKLSKSNSELIFGGIPYNKNEIMESKADNKILKDFNWNCSVDIRKGLSKIINSI